MTNSPENWRFSFILDPKPKVLNKNSTKKCLKVIPSFSFSASNFYYWRRYFKVCPRTRPNRNTCLYLWEEQNVRPIRFFLECSWSGLETASWAFLPRASWRSSWSYQCWCWPSKISCRDSGSYWKQKLNFHSTTDTAAYAVGTPCMHCCSELIYYYKRQKLHLRTWPFVLQIGYSCRGFPEKVPTEIRPLKCSVLDNGLNSHFFYLYSIWRRICEASYFGGIDLELMLISCLIRVEIFCSESMPSWDDIYCMHACHVNNATITLRPLCSSVRRLHIQTSFFVISRICPPIMPKGLITPAIWMCRQFGCAFPCRMRFQCNFFLSKTQKWRRKRMWQWNTHPNCTSKTQV
jgi:hypothetical protein